MLIWLFFKFPGVLLFFEVGLLVESFSNFLRILTFSPTSVFECLYHSYLILSCSFQSTQVFLQIVSFLNFIISLFILPFLYFINFSPPCSRCFLLEFLLYKGWYFCSHLVTFPLVFSMFHCLLCFLREALCHIFQHTHTNHYSCYF